MPAVTHVRDQHHNYERRTHACPHKAGSQKLALFLAVHQLGIGLAFAATAALLHLPFSQRMLMLMGYRTVE